MIDFFLIVLMTHRDFSNKGLPNKKIINRFGEQGEKKFNIRI